MKNNLPEVALRAQWSRPLLARLLGQDPGRLIYQPYGHGNIVFALPDLGLVAKTSDQPNAFRHTARNVEILGGLSIPVPRIVAEGFDGGISVLLLEWIPGVDLGTALPSMGPSEMDAVAREVCHIQRRMASLPDGQSYGWLSIGASGEFPSWRSVVERDLNRLAEPYRSELAPLFESLVETLAQTPATPFLDDLTVKNVIVYEGRLVGIVDLEFICYGDPLYWLALAETTVMLDVGPHGASYCESLRRHWPHRLDLLGLYESMFAAHFLGRDLDLERRERMAACYRERFGQ